MWYNYLTRNFHYPESLVTKYLFLCYLDDNSITKDLIINMI